ncbi:transcription factor [Fusarium globosum]|uniref:Transcription factor n=1 Tax=Fusarium globosum TaxID=78864 RepID=A0A8H5YF08_9HYPO|nr:transcription factor [Fusarium globosum]
MAYPKTAQHHAPIKYSNSILRPPSSAKLCTFSSKMNFYPAPPVIKAEIYLRIPDDKRCLGQESEWRGGFAGSFQHIFLEGPVVDSAGNLYIVDVPYGRILKIDGEKNVSVACTWDGEPNGLVGTADGDLLVADYKQGILSFSPETGKIGPKLTRKNLERFKGPNDLIVDSKGNLYFTDQGQTGMTDPTGRVYRLSPDGRLDTLLANGPSPNGLVLSRDERFLYVAMTRANQVWRLPLHADGTTSKAGVFFQSFGNAGPDGLALDEEASSSCPLPSHSPAFHSYTQLNMARPNMIKATRRAIKDSPKEIFNWYLLACTCIWSFSGVAKGFDEGNIASLVIMEVFKERFGIDNQTDHEYANTKGWIVAIATAGAVFGCLGCVWLTQRLGRTRTFQFFTVVYMAGIFGQTFSSGNLGALYATRVIAGIGIGATTVLPSVYIAEISPQPIRGLLTLQYTCCQQLGVVFGFFFNYGVTKYHAGTNLQWQLPTALQLIPALIWGVGTFFTPETPRFLLSQNKRTEALATLSRFRGLPEDHPYVQSEFQGIESQLNHEIEIVSGANTWDLIKETFTDLSNRRRFVLMFACHVFGQWSGANAITQYSPTIFGYLGIEGTEARFLATGCYAILKFVSVLIFSVFVIDFIGRRRSLMTGITMQIFTLAFVGAYLKVTNGWTPEKIEASSSAMAASRAAIAAIYIHAIAWSIGWFSIPYLVSAEVFPLRIRSINVSILMAVHWAMYFGCSRAMPSLLAATQRYGAFMFFLSICTVSLVYVYFAMPETSGRSLESMDKLFERPWYTVHKIAYPTADDLKPAAREILEPEMKDQDMIDELERREQELSNRLQELESVAVTDPSTVDTSSPDDRHTVRSIAASSPATREGASLSLSWAHIQNPFLLRRSIWALHQRLFNGQGTSAKASSHDLFRAFMICAIGAVLPYRNKLHHRHPEAYYNAALQHLGGDFLTRGLDSVQDLLLICRLGIYHPIGTSIWDVVRLCGRLCIELGLHNGTDVHGDLLQTQLRRRVFWQFYLIDRYSSTTLDRPFLIDDEDIETKFPVEVSDEELEAASQNVQSLDSFSYTREPNVQNEMTVFFISVRLRQISSHIQTEFSKLRRKISNTRSKHLLAGHIHVVMTKLFKELKDWRNSNPIIQEPSCLYETQEWYDLLIARERLSVLRRAIDLVPKVNGSPPKEILTVFLRSALETIERYHIICQKREMMTHTRSYFHMLFTAALSVMYCISVSKKLTLEDMRASHQGLLRCQELLNSVARQLPDAKSYVSVFEALHRDVSQRLWPNVRDMPGNVPVDPAMGFSNDISNFNGRSFSPDLGTNTLSNGLANMPDFSTNRQFFDHGLQPRTNMMDSVNQFDVPEQDGNGISEDYQDGSSVNWALLNYDSLWNMESALGQYVYGDPTNPSVWDGFEF